MKQWYLLHVQTGKEEDVSRALEMKGHESYCPLVYTDTRNPNEKKKVRPMFPAYVLVKMSEQQDDFGPVHSERYVHSFIRSIRMVDGNLVKYPAIVADTLVRAIRAREDDQGIHGEQRQYGKGDYVQFTSGPFKHYRAIIESVSSIDRVRLLVDGVTVSAKTKEIEPLAS